MRSSKHIPRPASATLAHRVRNTAARWWRRTATVAAGVMVVGMGYHVIFGQNGLTAYEHKREESRDLRREVTALEAENGRFRGHVARLEKDPGAIEEQARQELHYARPGEVIIALPVTAESGVASGAR